VTDPSPRRRWSRSTVLILTGLSACAPLTIDLYLPALPEIERALAASPTSVEVSLTACVLGIAAGQLLIGPLSDVAGRRWPLIAGLILYVLSSLAGAAAPSMAVLDVVRFAQGVGGAAGIVIARSMVRDTYSGTSAAELYATISSVVPLAPILAPAAGGVLLLVGTWRGVFVAQAAIGMTLLLAVAIGTRETLPPSRRQARSAAGALRSYRNLLTTGSYVRVLTAGTLGFAAFFAYVSASSFVYQSVLGFSAQAYSLLFAVNGGGLLLTNAINARLIRTILPQRMLTIGLRLQATVACLVLLAAISNLGAAIMLPLLLALVVASGLIITNALVLTMADQGEQAGSAAALFGSGQFAIGAIVAPFVGLAGASAIPMGAVMAACALGAFAAGQTMLARGGSARTAAAPHQPATRACTAEPSCRESLLRG
jgi:MFS transporter, DHA1 family, multidrug resistance protein